MDDNQRPKTQTPARRYRTIGVLAFSASIRRIGVSSRASNLARLTPRSWAADPTGVRRLVLGLGPAAEVVGPAWFAEQVRAEAAAALAAYAS